jgi:hypothetical protein
MVQGQCLHEDVSGVDELAAETLCRGQRLCTLALAASCSAAASIGLDGVFFRLVGVRLPR